MLNKRLIIFQEPNHAKKISNIFQREKDVIVSFSVPGVLALKKNDIKSFFPDELVTIPCFDSVGMENIERAKKICQLIDRKLSEKFSFLKDNNVRLFNGSYFYVKVFLDSVFSSYLLLEELFKEMKTEQVVVFKTRYNVGSLVKGQDGMISALVENIFAKKNNDILVIEDNSETPDDANGLSLKRYIKRKYESFQRIMKIKKCSARGVLLSDTHDIPYVVNEVFKDVCFYNWHFSSGGEFVFFDCKVKRQTESEDLFEGISRELFESISEDGEYLEMFDQNKDFSDFINMCLREYFIEHTKKFMPYAEDIKNCLLDMDSEMVLTSHCRIDIGDAFLIGLAKELGVPVVVYQEGGGAGYLDWPLFSLDTDLSDFFLTYGEGVKDSKFILNKEKIIPVGSIRLSNIKERINNNKPLTRKIYVVLDLFKMSMWQHYPYNGGFFSQAYAHQLNLLNSLKQFKNIEFVIKTIKGRAFLYEDIIDKNHMNISTKLLSNVLDEASAFILDWPSTVLQEVLLTDRPVAVLYNEGTVHFEEKALDFLRKRIRINSDKSLFQKEIEALLGDIENGSQMTSDTEFIDRYCIRPDVNERLESFVGVLKGWKTREQ